MKLLLDTHVFLWALLEPRRLGPVADVLRSPDTAVALSAVSCWEIAIKESLGKIALPGPARAWVPSSAARLGVPILPLDPAIALAVADLPWLHRDPFDRLLVAQAAAGFTLVTPNRALGPYGVDVLWVG